MLQVVGSLELERLEGLVLYLPPRPPRPHNFDHVIPRQLYVRYPGKCFGFGSDVLFVVRGIHVFRTLDTFQHIDFDIRVGEVEGQPVQKPKAAFDPLLDPLPYGLLRPELPRKPVLLVELELPEECPVLVGLHPQDVAEVFVRKHADKGGVRKERVPEERRPELRMLRPEFFRPPPCRLEFAVLLGAPVPVRYGFGAQGDDLRQPRVDDARPEELVVVGRCPRTVLLFYAVVALHPARGKVPRPVQCDQVSPVEVPEPLEGVAPLECGENLFEGGPDAPGADGVEDGAHLRIGCRGIYGEEVPQAPPLRRIRPDALFERQEGGFLEGKHGEPRHKGIRHGYFDVPETFAVLLDPPETVLYQGVEVVGVKIFSMHGVPPDFGGLCHFLPTLGRPNAMQCYEKFFASSPNRRF